MIVAWQRKTVKTDKIEEESVTITPFTGNIDSKVDQLQVRPAELRTTKYKLLKIYFDFLEQSKTIGSPAMNGGLSIQ